MHDLLAADVVQPAFTEREMVGCDVRKLGMLWSWLLDSMGVHFHNWMFDWYRLSVLRQLSQMHRVLSTNGRIAFSATAWSSWCVYHPLTSFIQTALRIWPGLTSIHRIQWPTYSASFGIEMIKRILYVRYYFSRLTESEICTTSKHMEDAFIIHMNSQLATIINSYGLSKYVRYVR